MGIKLKNQRLDVTRTIEYSPGDSLNFSMKFYIDVDSISYLNGFEIRIAFLDKNFNRLGYEYDFFNDINTKVWEKEKFLQKGFDPNIVYAKVKFLLHVTDSISIFLDDAVHESNYYNTLKGFTLNNPQDLSQFNFGDTTQFSCKKGFNHDSGQYRFESHLLFEFDNLIANSDFEITGESNCNG